MGLRVRAYPLSSAVNLVVTSPEHFFLEHIQCRLCEQRKEARGEAGSEATLALCPVRRNVWCRELRLWSWTDLGSLVAVFLTSGEDLGQSCHLSELSLTFPLWWL